VQVLLLCDLVPVLLVQVVLDQALQREEQSLQQEASSQSGEDFWHLNIL
jgi:hypothetical protein